MKAKRRYDMTGRAVKAAATKKRICDTAIALYCSRSIEEFTLEEVAAQADTTVQTVLRDFGSKDELIYAALDEMARGGVFLKPTSPGDVKAAVDAFFEIYESIGDMVMRRLNEEQRRPALKPILEEGRTHHRLGVKSAFAPQLERLSGSARSRLLTSLVVLTDVYVWKLLRRDMTLSRSAAEAIVVRMILGVIQQEKANGKVPDALAELVRRREPAA
jgi:AcrR family transcriptional regulator